MPPRDIDASFVAEPVAGLAFVAVGDELVLLDGWDVATRLSATGAMIWSSLDGRTKLADVAANLAAEGAVDEDVVTADVLHFVRELGQRGLLADVAESLDEPDIHLEVVPPHAPGDVVDDLELRDLRGSLRRTSDIIESGTALIVNWNPHCGYCARIAPDLVGVQSDLGAAGCKLVLAATGGAEANSVVVDANGLEVDVLLLGIGQDLFRAAGTPSAYHVDATGQIIGPPAYGADQVPALARQIAGVEAGGADAYGSTNRARYLLDRDGVCGPAQDLSSGPRWDGTRVYRVGDHHVGIRHDSPATAALLDRLFLDQRVDDPRAGHSFSVALDSSLAVSRRRSTRCLNLLVQPGQPTVRSRDPARVLQALLSRLTDEMVPFDPACGRLQIDAIAVVHAWGAALLPRALHGFAPRLQAVLARNDVALADVRYPQVDLSTADLVIPEPSIDHDPGTLDAVANHADVIAERASVRPGRYPLTTWCVVNPGPPGAKPLSPAEAAAATLSTTLNTDDAPERVRQLGRLFTKVDGYGIWYDSEIEAISALTTALGKADPASGSSGPN
jgi:thiol-disulfide isomerase/thioredoxin